MAPRRIAIILIVTGIAAMGVLTDALGGNAKPGAPATGKSAAQSYREIDWLALVPKDWNPHERLKDKNVAILNARDKLKDDDELAKQWLRELREVLDTAPAVDAMDGEFVKLPGYVVPLEETGDGLKEFLLVPYFGACIHTPPPPANQIVHVVASGAVKGIRAMDAVWVKGRLKTLRRDTSMGVSGYALAADSIEPYRKSAP
jgi:hypothetical protein